jgi:hypothetical protein
MRAVGGLPARHVLELLMLGELICWIGFILADIVERR